MANVTSVRDALVGTIIRTEGSITAIIDDIGETGASVQTSASKRPLILPLRDIQAVVMLWSELRSPPTENRVQALGIPPARAIYLVPFVRAMRSAPGIQAWLRAGWPRRASEESR